MDNNILDDNLTTKEEEQKIVEPRYAGFWIRTLAISFDALILMTIGFFADFLVNYVNSLPIYILSVIISVAYKPLFEYKLGTTLGKMVLGLKIVNIKNQTISLQQAIIRSLPFLIDGIVSIIYMLLLDPSFSNVIYSSLEFRIDTENSENIFINYIGFLFIFISCIVVAFDNKKQGLHDKLAKTFCIHND